MRIRWTPAAAADLQNIGDYLDDHAPSYRQYTLRKLTEAVRALAQNPHRGRPGSVAGTRELVFAPLPYVGVYRTVREQIEVLRIYHSAQDRP